jgi:hypothetical protein
MQNHILPHHFRVFGGGEEASKLLLLLLSAGLVQCNPRTTPTHAHDDRSLLRIHVPSSPVALEHN